MVVVLKDLSEELNTKRLRQMDIACRCLEWKRNGNWSFSFVFWW